MTSLWGTKWGVARLGFEGPADVAALPLLALVFGGLGLVLLPLSNGMSRWRERRADRYALQATGKPDAFAARPHPRHPPLRRGRRHPARAADEVRDGRLVLPAEEPAGGLQPAHAPLVALRRERRGVMRIEDEACYLVGFIRDN